MKLKNLWSKVLVLLFAMALIAGVSPMAGAETINVGALNDVTGATSDVGKDYALGIADAIRYVTTTAGSTESRLSCINLITATVFPKPL